MTTEQKFNAAVNVIKNLPKNGSYKPSNELMLRFYAFYKQATEGPNKSPKPNFWEAVQRAKWGAWSKLGDMPREEAMASYVAELNKIVETMALTDSVANFLSSLDAMSEILPVEDIEMCLGPTLDAVRSRSNSPEESSAASSQQSSPLRTSDISQVGLSSADHTSEIDDDEEDYFSDTMEIVESVKDINSTTRKPPDGTVANHTEQFSRKGDDVSKVLMRTVENLSQDYQQLNNRMNTLEQKVLSVKKSLHARGLFRNLSPETITFIILWPLVASYLIRRLCYQKS